MIAILLACGLFCVGSIGAIGFVGWRMARDDADHEQDDAVNPAGRRGFVEPQSRERFDRVARAVADGLQADERLADSYTPDGKPLLSWRVHLLPRLGEEALYRQFKLGEPWDSPANRPLINQVPQVYLPTTNFEVGRWSPGWTHIRGFAHPGSIFEPRARYMLKNIPGGPQDTLAIVDSAEPDIWTKPDSWTWEAGRPRPKFGWLSQEREAFLAASADGRVWIVRRTIPDEVLRPLFDRRIGPRDMNFMAHVVRN